MLFLCLVKKQAADFESRDFPNPVSHEALILLIAIFAVGRQGIAVQSGLVIIPLRERLTLHVFHDFSHASPMIFTFSYLL
jgi:hypothetical protein